MTVIRPDTPWQKSSFSGANGDCLEISSRAGHVLVREGDDPRAVVRVRPAVLRAFLRGVKGGTFEGE